MTIAMQVALCIVLIAIARICLRRARMHWRCGRLGAGLPLIWRIELQHGAAAPTSREYTVAEIRGIPHRWPFDTRRWPSPLAAHAELMSSDLLDAYARLATRSAGRARCSSWAVLAVGGIWLGLTLGGIWNDLVEAPTRTLEGGAVQNPGTVAHILPLVIIAFGLMIRSAEDAFLEIAEIYSSKAG